MSVSPCPRILFKSGENSGTAVHAAILYVIEIVACPA